MAVRLRKLAKELRRDPAELLGILHALGFARFRSPHDMLSDPIVGQLRGALRDGWPQSRSYGWAKHRLSLPMRPL